MLNDDDGQYALDALEDAEYERELHAAEYADAEDAADMQSDYHQMRTNAARYGN